MTAVAGSLRPTSTGAIDAAVEEVRSHARAWARLEPRHKAVLLRRCMDGVAAIAEMWTAAACSAKGLRIDRSEASEEWIGGPLITLRAARLMAQSLEALDRGRLSLGRGARVRDDGRLEVGVFPASRLDAATFPGYRAAALMLPGVGRAEARALQAVFHRREAPDGSVCAVLGAGNVAAIPPTDVIHKMFGEARACVLKLSPVNDYLGPLLERALRPLIEHGVLRIVHGGAAEGAHLVRHPSVDDVHLTGSARTYESLIWGPPGPERERRRREHAPLLRATVSAELGNVSPVIVVPAHYEPTELAFQARAVASSVVNNASFNCNASKIVVVAAAWKQRESFMRLIRDALHATPPRRAYYPGARRRYEDLLAGHDTVRLGAAAPGALPWAVAADLDPSDAGERLFTTEPFCAILSETGLPAREPVEFLAQAVRFCNERLWGTLSAQIVMPHDPDLLGAREAAIRELRYGTVGVNVWPAVSYAVMTPPWGGHPSTTPTDVQSGLGWVHNTYMLDGVEKVVLRAPLRPRLKPVWHVGHRTAHRTARRMVDLEARPGWSALGRVAVAALRG